MFIDPVSREYDFKKLKDVVKVVTRNLNKIIDVNYYPVPEVSTNACIFVAAVNLPVLNSNFS